MKNLTKIISYKLLFLLLLFGCKVNQEVVLQKSGDGPKTDDGIIHFSFLQINDVYEIAPLEGGKAGGMARVGKLYKDLKEKNTNTLFVHAGDFLNPSLIGTLKYEGKRIKGKQMVEVMNACGVELVAFGNHEFDIDENELQERLNESNFEWLGTSVLHNQNGKIQPFHKELAGEKVFVPENYIWEIDDKDGTKLKIGIFSATINSNPKDYVVYEDYYQEAVKSYLELNAKTDIVLGLTHLEMIQDLKLASMLPNVPLLMGGHDHENIIDTVGNVVVAKADANAKTAYVHDFILDKNRGTYELNSQLIRINDSLEGDPEVENVVNKWLEIQDGEIKTVICDPYEIIYNANPPLDGRESSIRNKQTNLGNIITAAMMASSKGEVDAAILNGGSIRIDDQLSGNVMAIDLFRTMPFGGEVWEVELKGSLLKKVLDIGIQNKGIGGYLQWQNIVYNENSKSWTIDKKSLVESMNYKIAVNDFLLTGFESKLDFFTPENEEIILIDKPNSTDSEDVRRDIRAATIDYMKKL